MSRSPRSPPVVADAADDEAVFTRKEFRYGVDCRDAAGFGFWQLAFANKRALTPDKPVIRGTAANPDTYFQCREASNPWYDAAYGHVSDAMQAFGKQTGRHYRPFEYVGHPQAERIMVLMGSAIGTCEEVIERLRALGAVSVRTLDGIQETIKFPLPKGLKL